MLGQYGRDALGPEFGRLLHDEVHALAARDTLHELHLERRLDDSVTAFTESDGYRCLVDGVEECFVFTVVAVKHGQRIARAQPEHVAHITGLLAAELKCDPGPQVGADVYPGEGHRLRLCREWSLTLRAC